MNSDSNILQDLNIILDSSHSRKVKHYKKRINPFISYSDQDFKELYRLDKCTAMKIVHLVKEDLVHTTGHGGVISPEIMVMATIRYIAKGTYQKDIADAHGISQQSMTQIIRKLVTAIASRIRNFIYFPLDPEGLQKLKTGFYKISNFPQCIGAIDCTHIKIKSPGGEIGGRHICRKGFCSINVQVICDSDCHIMDIVARWRGSVHDSRIWRESGIKTRLEETNLRGGVLLGDSGYACSKILLTPFRIGTQLSHAQQKYNVAHIKTRNIVERLFGQLKNKFRCCLNGINVDLDTAKNMIVAIAVLFNIAKDNNIRLIEDEEDENIFNNEETDSENDNPRVMPGSIIRQNFINKYF